MIIIADTKVCLRLKGNFLSFIAKNAASTISPKTE